MDSSTFTPKNITKSNTPKTLSNIGNAALLFTSGMIPIIMALPLTQTTISWSIGLLNGVGLATKVISMMFGIKIQGEENKEEIEEGNVQ